MSGVGDKLTTVDDLKAAYDDVDGKLLNNDFSVYTRATTPYNNNTLIPLRLGNDNLATDFGTLSTQLGGGGGTNQGALVHYTAQYGPFGTSGQSSTLNTTVNDSNVTADMCVLKAVFSNPSAQTSDWTVTCSHNGTTGQVNFQGGITGTTNVALYFGVVMTAAPSLLVNLGSNNSDNILKANVSPGVTGVLSIANGGTGASTLSAARANLAISTYDAVTFTPETGITSSLFIRRNNAVVCVNGYLTSSSAFGISQFVGTIAQGSRPVDAVRTIGGIAEHAYDLAEIAYISIDSDGKVYVKAKSNNAYKIVYFSASYIAQN